MKYSLIGFLLLLFQTAKAQSPLNPAGELYQNAPAWAQLMHSANPNVDEVDALYLEYYRNYPFKKSFHTQYYKRWRRAVHNFLAEDGSVDGDKKLRFSRLIDQRQRTYTHSNRAGNWSLLGPSQNLRPDGTLSGAQANIYSIGSCAAFPEVMYCGTESGEIYKSTDGANTWFNVSYAIVTAVANQVVVSNAGFKAIAVHPTNPDIVYAGSGNEVYKTVDGGQTWNVVLLANAPLVGYIETPSELHIHADNPDIVFLAGRDGLYRSDDAGSNWNQVLTDYCYDIKAQPGTPNTLYAVRLNSDLVIPEFLRSIDAGITWEVQSDGWYSSTHINRSVGGARLAVSDADPQRIYAFLIGNSKPGDAGFIGLYRSDDGGSNWLNAMGYDGGPYDLETHPNLISNASVTYNQGFYNCAIMASNTNADELLVGGIGMWRSSDAGGTYSCVYNYECGDFYPMHVDMQDFRAFGNTYWASTDGGIYRSDDLFASQPTFMMKGIHGSDFWGFGSGWNYDILAGGTFHNGVDVYTEDYPAGDFLDLGGGEPASGYVNPGDTLRLYYSRQAVVVSPDITEDVTFIPMGLGANESPWFAESSKLLFHPSCYNHIYLGSENQLYKSMDGGTNYEALYTAAENTLVLDMDISRENPETMYAVVRPVQGNSSLRKTTDDWATSTAVDLPAGGSRHVIISLDPEDDDIIWVAYARGSNGNKVFRSNDGGVSWTNETSAALNDQNIHAICTIGGTDGGVYLNTNVTCYYKNNNLAAWDADDLNLPLTISTRDIRPFYRDGKVRIASYGKGIWESPLYETPTRPVAKIMVNQLTGNCLSEVFYFDDYSMLNHAGASWDWTFENASIAQSSLRNPAVTFNEAGTHLVTLEVTNAAGVSAADSLYVTFEATDYDPVIEEGFETAFPPVDWTVGPISWSYNTEVGGYGLSESCMMVDNYSISQVGERFDIMAPVDLSEATAEESLLIFDVAYSRYSEGYADSLEILVSADCGMTWTSHYFKGGTELATAPDFMDGIFVPTDNEWRTDTVDLSAYTGASDVLVRFSNINAYGQALYVDNVHLGNMITSVGEVTGKDQLTIFPNPIRNNGKLSIAGASGRMECSIFNLSGKLIGNVFTEAGSPISLRQWNLSAGTYLISVRSGKLLQRSKLIVVGERE